jgi:acyl carrier protein
MNSIYRDLLNLIFETCNITDELPQNPDPEALLFGPDSLFGLDSLDAVEIAVAIQKNYGIRITDRNVYQSLGSLAACVGNHLNAA